MSEKINQNLDFSKLEDQEKFQSLPEEEKIETIKTSQEEAEAMDDLITQISKGYIDDAQQIIKTFNLPLEVIQSPEVQQAAKDGLK